MPVVVDIVLYGPKPWTVGCGRSVGRLIESPLVVKDGARNNTNTTLSGTGAIMVVYLLCLKGELEGVQSIVLDRTANICISVRDTKSDETREKVVFNMSETLEQEESDREPAHHFALTWEG